MVASNFTSAFVDRQVFTGDVMVDGRPLNACLSMYLFGDGAGAVVLRGERRERADDDAPGILASYGGADYLQLVVREGGGALRPPLPGRACRSQHAFVVDGKLVAERFPGYMNRCIEEALRPYPSLRHEVKRYYLHQANKRWSRDSSQPVCPGSGWPCRMDHYGNTSAAGTLILRRILWMAMQLGSGELVLFAAIGAGVRYGRSSYDCEIACPSLPAFLGW